MNRIGVMGGTFDPIHTGHLVAADEALHAFELVVQPMGMLKRKQDEA